MKNIDALYKEKLKTLIKNKSFILSFVRYSYTCLFHRDRLFMKKSYGDLNPDEIILIIRPRSEDCIQGLMSLLVQTLRWIVYAENNHYKFYIDFKNYKTQYSNLRDNVWEYYFEQPCHLQYDTVYRSKNVYLSGVSWKNKVNVTLFRGEVFFDKKLMEECHLIINRNIRFSTECLDLVHQENLMLNVESCIGVYLRGTDYVKLRPPGEYVQPKIEDVIMKIDTFLKRYRDTKIFLVTEDYEYYKILLEKYKNQIITVSYDQFVKNYDGNDFLSKSNVLEEDKKMRGMHYLVKLILLSKCKYLISSITMGSVVAYCINGGKYKDEFIFSLGQYS